MTVVVTGATGFLGTNLVAALAEAGHQVRASGMHGSETKYLERLGVEIALADVTNAAEIEALVEGAEVVYHVAGDTSFWSNTVDRQRRINVDGSLNVARACRKHDVRRMVHTSTIDVLGHDPSGHLITEANGRYNFDGLGYNYGDTKHRAEQELRRMHAAGLDIVFIYPGFICGPYDFNLQIGRLFFDLRDGKVPGAPPGGTSLCHVGEVANAHIAAAERGRSGEGYTCAGWNLPTATILDLLADAISAPRVKRTLPESVLVAYGHAMELAARTSKTPPEMNPGMARYLSRTQYHDCTKAVAELDYRIAPIPEIIGDAVEWYRAEGYDI